MPISQCEVRPDSDIEKYDHENRETYGTSAGETQPNLFEDPGDTVAVVFEASSRLSQYKGGEIWMGAVGVSQKWGGCNVLASQDGTKYKQIGTIQVAARLGTLQSNFPSGSDPDTVNSLIVNMEENSGPLDAGSTADADQGNTRCYVDGEILSYSALSLSGQNQYTMGTYIRRGQMGSAIASHAYGSEFLRLDDAVFQFEYDPSWIGQTIYFKFQSFNTFNNSPQDVSTLTPVTFAIPGQSVTLPPARTTTLINPNFELSSDIPPYGWIFQNITVWGGFANLTQSFDTSTPYTGSQSYVASMSGGFTGGSSEPFLINSQEFVVQAGDSYELGAAMKLTAGGTGRAQVQLIWMDASGNLVGTPLTISCGSISAGWVYATAIGTVPSGAVAAVVALCLGEIGFRTTAEFDSITLTLLPDLSTGVVGTLPIASVSARSGSISYVIDGAGSVVTTGIKGQLSIPANCTITGWVITADQSGSAVVDILHSTYSGFPTTSSIAGTDKPTLSSAQKNQDSALSGWGSTALTAGDILQFDVDSCSTCTRLIVTLNVSITG
jgi:hypothetical protein